MYIYTGTSAAARWQLPDHTWDTLQTYRYYDATTAATHERRAINEVASPPLMRERNKRMVQSLEQRLFYLFIYFLSQSYTKYGTRK